MIYNSCDGFECFLFEKWAFNRHSFNKTWAFSLKVEYLDMSDLIIIIFLLKKKISIVYGKNVLKIDDYWNQE
jgi:hypothetical protein